MTKADSITLRIPAVALLGFNDSAFDNFGSLKTGTDFGSKAYSSTLKSLHGINDIKISPSNEVIIQISAKCLNELYMQGISKETIRQVVFNINNSNVIKFDVDSFLEHAEVLKVDITDNIKVNGNVRDYMTALHLHQSRQLKAVEFYNRQDNSGIVFKKSNLYSKCYSKELDIYKAKNKDLVSQFPILLQESQGIARWETSFRTFEQMRDGFQLTGKVIYLNDVLNSDVKVNYNTFNKVIDMNMKVNTNTFDTLKELNKFEAIENILRKNKFDLKTCRTYVQSKVPTISPSVLSKEMKTLKEHQLYFQSQDALSDGINTTELLKELQIKLAE